MRLCRRRVLGSYAWASDKINKLNHRKISRIIEQKYLQSKIALSFLCVPLLPLQTIRQVIGQTGNHCYFEYYSKIFPKEAPVSPMLGTASFFLSPQPANPHPNFNFLNSQPQLRNCTFKSVVDCNKCTTAWLVIELLFRMANLSIAQPLLLSDPTQNRFKRL